MPPRQGFSSGQQAEIVMTVLTAEPSPGEAPGCAGLHAAYAEFVKHPQVERTIEASTALLGRQRELACRCAEMRRVEFVGPQVGSELAYDGGLALFCVCIFIMLYLAVRFEWKFSVAAIVANFHDVVLVVGMFSIFRWEFSLPVLAAVLAVLGYAVNESVIIFDRVREHFRTMRKASATEVIDRPSRRPFRARSSRHGLHADDDRHDAAVRRACTALFRAGPDRWASASACTRRYSWPPPLRAGWA